VPTKIPKIIHCCWFGGNPMPHLLQHCMQSWQEFCPDWTIRLWNEETFDIQSHSFTSSAYQAKKYAFVSDYVRAWALFNHGGVYLDTDVELKKSLDIFCHHDGFSGFESIGIPFTAVWGSAPQHPLAKHVLDYYQDKIYRSREEPPNTGWISKMIEERYQIDIWNDEHQSGSDGSTTFDVYPSSHFCLDFPVNYATHHFHGSWLPHKTVKFKDAVHTNYYQQQLIKDGKISKHLLKTFAPIITWRQILYLIRWYFKSMFKK
jgi:hypothetical protein